MSRIRVVPGPLRGVVQGPPSKSYTHRALVAGHLSRRRYLVRSPLDSEDTRATLRVIRALGTHVERWQDSWLLTPQPTRSYRRRTVDCGESGTTLRFGSALAALRNTPLRLTGEPRLGERPMAPLLQTLRELGAEIRTELPGRGLPITVRGPMHSGRVTLPASESSQFASALFLTLPLLDGPSEIRLQGTIVSEPYLDATMAVLKFHGVRVARKASRFSTPGGQRFHKGSFTVPADASSSAYLWAAAAVSGGSVTVHGLDRGWPQADLAILDILERWGAHVTRHSDGATVSGEGRRPFSCDLTSAPDLLPLVGILAALAPGTSTLRGAAHASFKESDRRQETVALARSLGARVRATQELLEIRGRTLPSSLRRLDLFDHRLFFSAWVAALGLRRPSALGPAEATRKSFPTFLSLLTRLGAQVEVDK
jgi:3-phosphoshikimate 1-carboxyvinyltransferase